MKTIHCIIIFLFACGIACAEEVEFRLVTLLGGDLSQERISELISEGRLGWEHRRLVPIKNGKLSVIDTREIQYPIEYAKGGVVIKKERRKIGTTITGTIVPIEGHKVLKFNFTYSNKKGDHVYKPRGGVGVAAPVFTSFSTSFDRILKEEDEAWHVVPIFDSNREVKRYVVFRLQ